VGANVGQYAKQLRGLGYQQRILSFEPTSSAYLELQREVSNDALWQLAPRMAIGAERGEVEINVSSDSDMSSILELEAETLTALPGSVVSGKERVPLETLDAVFTEFAGEANAPFLKVDTQGFEWPVLLGAEKVLSKFKGVQLELSLFPLYKGEKTFEEIGLWLRSKGFDPHLVIPGYFSRKLNRQMQIDIVFFKNQ
jgi:FkbM family methyltransferase